MPKSKTVGVVIVNYQTPDLTLAAVKALEGLPVYVVDNGPADKALTTALARISGVSYWPLNKNMGFGGGNNYALKKIWMKYDYLLLLNSDAQISRRAVLSLLEQADLSGAAVASCRLTYPDGSFQANAGSLPSWLPVATWISGLDDIANLISWRLPSYQESKPRYYLTDKEVGWVSGSLMLLESGFAHRIGFFDEAIFMYAEDVDLCWRVRRAGGKVIWFVTPSATHIGGASSSEAKYKQWLGEFRGLLYLYRKYYGVFGKYFLKTLFYLFIPLRILLFFVFGKIKYAQYYCRILAKI